MMNDTLEQCIRQIATLMKQEILENVSFRSQADYIELSTTTEIREEKLPAIIMRGPTLKVDNFFREIDDKIIKNLNDFTYSKSLAPKVYDVIFKISIISEGDMEGLETISKLISFFASNNQITANGKIYNVELTKVPEDDLTTNISDLNRYKGEFTIEGIEFDVSLVSGKLVQNIDVTILKKLITQNGG